MNWRATNEYVSAAEALSHIRSDSRIFVHGASAYPRGLVTALMDRADDLDNIEILHLHANGPTPYTDPRFAGRFRHRALFVGASTRAAVQEGTATYVPVFLSDIPALFRSGRLGLDVALLHVSPPDEHGFCSLGTSVDVSLAAARAAALVIAQVNPRMPRSLGDSFLHVSGIDYAVEVDEQLSEHAPRPPDAEQLAIGRHVAELVEDGSVLQLGIGTIPNAVLAALTDRRDLGIHSEVISDGVVDLVERGVITGARKTVNPGKVVTAFVDGTRRVYDFIADNPAVEMRPTDYTNNASVISRLDNMVAINSCLEMDLTGQVCAESIGPVVYSGVGGQVDFLRGAALSRGGKPVVALPATARGGTVSRIVPTLTPGAAVTTSRAHIHHVVTEFGRVDLHGLDLRERARALISLAHPAFREDLTAAARQLHYL